MWLTGLLVIFGIILSCLAEIDISEAKDWTIKVPESGFKFKICPNKVPATTHICYQGNPQNDQKHNCPDNFCGIFVTKMTGTTTHYSFHVGGISGEIYSECFKVDVTPKELKVQGFDKTGTCQLKTGWNGKLLFNVLSLEDGTIHLENADWWKGNDDTGKANVNVIIFSILGTIVGIGIIAGGIALMCWWKKKKVDKEKKADPDVEMKTAVALTPVKPTESAPTVVTEKKQVKEIRYAWKIKDDGAYQETLGDPADHYNAVKPKRKKHAKVDSDSRQATTETPTTPAERELKAVSSSSAPNQLGTARELVGPARSVSRDDVAPKTEEAKPEVERTPSKELPVTRGKVDENVLETARESASPWKLHGETPKTEKKERKVKQRTPKRSESTEVASMEKKTSETEEDALKTVNPYNAIMVNGPKRKQKVEKKKMLDTEEDALTTAKDSKKPATEKKEDVSKDEKAEREAEGRKNDGAVEKERKRRRSMPEKKERRLDDSAEDVKAVKRRTWPRRRTNPNNAIMVNGPKPKQKVEEKKMLETEEDALTTAKKHVDSKKRAGEKKEDVSKDESAQRNQVESKPKEKKRGIITEEIEEMAERARNRKKK
uniref:Uncharacterized protein n=1 Tax=Panagrolaimus sp. JU765 TaxID=591449 RepID=A0AC34PZH6_9BILA